MRIIKCDIKEIKFNKIEYTEDLKKSILRIGFSFPIYVEVQSDEFVCVDGHKRLSAMYDLINDELWNRDTQVNIIIKNHANQRSNDCWRGRNHH